MSEKKNIDRIFQERFKDFEVAPNDAVWNKIQDRKKKDKKRVIIIPLWWRLGGIAAIIAIIASIGLFQNPFSNTTSSPTIVLDKTQNEDSTIEKNKNDIVSTSTQNNNTKEPNQIAYDSITTFTQEATIVDNTTDYKKINASSTASTPSPNIKTRTQTRETQIVTTTPNKFNNSDSNTSLIQNKDQIQKDVSRTSSFNTTAITTKNESSAIAQNTAIANTSKNNISTDTEVHSSIKNTVIDASTENSSAIAIASNASEVSKIAIDSIQQQASDINKKSIFDVIKEQEQETEEAIATTDQKSKKWNVTPNIAPVYYNSLGNGSSISDEFSDNNKNGGINLSYGVQIAYTINKRLSIRSGVHNVELSYATENVGFSPAVDAKNIPSINYNANSETILVSDFKPSAAPINNSLSTLDQRDPNFTQDLGFLNQEISYIEVPLEASYALVDKKLGVQMIGGISTLFLKDNTVSINAGDFTTPIGEANNLNNVSFSGNIGVGLNYKLTSKFRLNLEPILKYQFNALNDNPGNFKPYYLGVYTGVSYKF